MTAYLSTLSRDQPVAQKGIGLLIYWGWALTLLYFPSGVLLFYFGSAVYIRDLLLAAHLVACLIWIHRLGDLPRVLRRSAILLLVPIFLIPAVADPEYRFEALRTVKWTFFWLDWIFIGYLAFQYRRWNEWLGVFIGMTMFELLIEWVVGACEWHSGHYLFSTPTTWNETTPFGVQKVKELTLEGAIRIRGLQRDVFSFANLMAMSSLLGLAFASIVRPVWQRAAGFGWAAFFAVMLFVSGGRSALFGVFAAVFLSVAYAADRRFAQKWAKPCLLVWVGIALLVSCTGIGAISDMVSGAFLSKSHIGDVTSAYMRDENWSNLLGALEQQPIILVAGGPVSSLLDSKVAPMFHWADNQFLWDIYHLGIAGALAIAFYFFKVLPGSDRESPATDIVILCLIFVVGEGIARESLTFMGCMPLFAACGYVSASSASSMVNGVPIKTHHHRSHHHRKRHKSRAA